jgi:hypothetical protein
VLISSSSFSFSFSSPSSPSPSSPSPSPPSSFGEILISARDNLAASSSSIFLLSARVVPTSNSSTRLFSLFSFCYSSPPYSKVKLS